MSADEKDEKGKPAPWVPSPEQPVPPTTTEFNALVDQGSAVPSETADNPAVAGDGPELDADVVGEPPVTGPPPQEPQSGSAPQEGLGEAGAADDDLPPAVDPVVPVAQAPQPPDAVPDVPDAPLSTAERVDGPPSAQAGAAIYPPPPLHSAPTGDAPPSRPAPDAGPASPGAGSDGLLGGLIPEDRPELLLAAAFAGGVAIAIVLRTLARR